MRCLDYFSTDPASQLAADEALYSMVENGNLLDNAFRAWEVDSPFIVLGRGSAIAKEIDQSVCLADDIPVLRRTSGGATILAGPGCLMYTVVLRHSADSRLATIDATHEFVLKRTAAALNGILNGDEKVMKAGTSDLAMQLGGTGNSPLRKVSGNAMRRGRVATLYHGTLLYDFDLSLISRYLLTAPRQPFYRSDRDHGDFVANLPLDRQSLVAAIESAWETEPSEPPPPSALEEIDSLVREKYSRDSWNLRH